MQIKKYQSLSESNFQELSKEITHNLKVGDVITLEGELGVGKTCLSKYLINSLSDKQIFVNSPTFNLVNIYNVPLFKIWHFDLYRIEKPIDLYELGIEDALSNGLSIIEWPQIADSILPEKRTKIIINFSVVKDCRHVTIINN